MKSSYLMIKMEMAENTQYRFLKFAEFANLSLWDYYSLTVENKLSANFPLVKLGKLIKQRKDFITIKSNRTYKLCRVQIRGRGIVLRDQVGGESIKTKRQQLCKAGDFLVAEIDAKVGGYGIVPQELEGAIVSPHYFLFEIDKKMLLPEFLGLVIKTAQFSQQIKATGSTNYASIRPYNVLEYEIPLPEIDLQKKLVIDYNNKISEANKNLDKTKNLTEEIEANFLFQLGLKPFQLRERIKGLQFVDYADLERWDFFSTDNRIYKELKKSTFEVKPLGTSFDFVRRSWDKANQKSDTFRYIEIGSIDPQFGIIHAKKVQISKAPSRASQIVKEGDLIIGTTRPYLKKFAIVTQDYDNCVCSSGFSVIAASQNYYLPYLKQFLMCTYGIEQLKNLMTGTLYPAITETELKKVKCPLPDVKTQKEIMKLIERKKSEILVGKETIEILKETAQKDFEKKIFN